MRSVHRNIAFLVSVFALYLGITGTLIQITDLHTLWTHAPATDPNLQAIRESINGPPNYQVIADTDYSAAELPAGFGFEHALASGLRSATNMLGSTPVRYIEVRMAGNRPVIQVRFPSRLLAFDAVSGEELPDLARSHLDPTPPQSQGVPSIRTTIKGLHRMTAFGDRALYVNVTVGVGLCTLIFTGLVMYFRLLSARIRFRGPSPLWYAGGWWRTLHRGVAVIAALFVVLATLSGFMLAIDSLGHGLFMANLKAGSGPPRTRFADVSSPLTNAELPAMLRTTMAAFRAGEPVAPIKVIRLRYFAGMPQGIIVSGNQDVRQLVYNAASGRRVSMTEPGYPATGQPFGWQEHQLMKQIHRGDWLGLPGRGMDLIAGLSLVFLSASGIAMYLDLWVRRRRGGRAGLLWA